MDTLLTTVDRIASRFGRLNAVVDWVADKVSPHATAQASHCNEHFCSERWGPSSCGTVCYQCEIWTKWSWLKLYWVQAALACICVEYSCIRRYNTYEICGC